MARHETHDFEFHAGPGPFGADLGGGGSWNPEMVHGERRSFGGGGGGFSSTGIGAPRNLMADSLASLNVGGSHSPPVAPFSSLHHHNRPTLWWGELEPWMDEEYAKQVCNLMGWDPLAIKVPRPPPDNITGQQANNPGYCFLTFPTPAHAGQVLAQVNSGNTAMPNSSKPFVVNWASAMPPSMFSPPASQPTFPAVPAAPPQQAGAQPYPKEYSIFVGDLAPETSNSDLVAVFRNPVLGLRNDREPKFIRPFLSCKSAKIMLDPVTGVSRGYGFVRFTDEADQQRALIEMHGLYCLSRPMRISPATAKFKPPQSSYELPPFQFPSGEPIAAPIPVDPPTKSVSGPIAGGPSTAVVPSLKPSTANMATSSSGSTISSGSTSASSFPSSGSSNDDLPNLANNLLAQLARQYANGAEIKPSPTGYGPQDPLAAITAPAATSQRQQSPYSVSSPVEESWKHHAQARAILGNLIGPNGEQLTSTDPYNTTVFVGGLSPLISEDTLRTFFAPFGDIHYVKVPVGKHCGFVQFVRKADAERAIEKMQGFPVGGSRIRLSWGRSQYKAAQAAAQAAQSAAMQVQYGSQAPPNPYGLSHDQAIALLQKFGYFDQIKSAADSATTAHAQDAASQPQHERPFSSFSPGPPHDGVLDGSSHDRPVGAHHHSQSSSFSPFSPNPNLFSMTTSKERRDSGVDGIASGHYGTPNSSGPYFSQPLGSSSSGVPPELKVNTSSPGSTANSSKAQVPPGLSPTNSATRPSSASRYGSYLDGGDTSSRRPLSGSEQIAPISRPSSGQHPGSNEEDVLHDLNGTLASLDLDSRPSLVSTGSYRSSP